MRLDDFDRILSSEKPLAPSASFTKEVMARVQAEHLRRRRVPFPWLRFALTTLAWAIPVYLLLSADPVVQAMDFVSHHIYAAFATPAGGPIADATRAVSASLLGTIALVWLSLRLAGRR